MRNVSAEEIDSTLTYPALIDALDHAFRADIEVPPRHHHTIARPGADATLLLMPAWTGADAPEKFLGCKIVTVFPDNARLDRPSVYGSYLLASAETGEALAVMDGRALTAWRTGAASALASRYLARADAAHLVMVGAGALASHLVRAHAAVRPIRRVTLWNRTRSRAVALAFGLAVGGIEATVADDLEAAVRDADIVSCATLSREPLIKGAWLKKGTHVDLVGGFTPTMREVDDQAVKRARLYVDTRAGAGREAGDIVIPLKRRVISQADIRGDLFDLCGRRVKGRTSKDHITVFKSVGTAVEDLAAAMLVWATLQREPQKT
ncbi:MAG TPA: ornithine cyclodeaminase family protein [Xanthobacteraceae bacterium]|nr:ornithine cyclodeaminase family protein [Xanthobacteraceae bacterium]